MSHESPFDVLGIAPTLELGSIKRAYFAALAKTPPHSDPEGFRRLRAAYGQLGDAQKRSLAWLRAPLDASDDALASWDAQFGAAVQRAREQAAQAQAQARTSQAFIDRVSRLRFTDVVRSGTDYRGLSE